MGIQGLLPFLRKASRPARLNEFRGQTVAVDAYCWLHKGAFSCADKLVRGEPTDGYVLYVMRQISQLLNHDMKPILVFDGCHLPSKAVTETKRRENRERNRKKAKELLREGKIKEAKECFQRCVDITSEMAADVIAACRARNVDIIVAPYEADAQLAYLNIRGIAQLVITEDSDLVLFGCKSILFKMDSSGNGVLVDQEKLHLSMGVPRDKFTFDKFRNMCILSGCDYLPSLHGIGLAKACKFFNVTSNPNVHSALCKIPSYLNMPQLEVTQEYRDGFMKARNTFLYQLVFDPIDRLLKPLTNYPDGMGPEDYPYAGKFVGHDRGLQIALGNVNVQTGEVVANFDPQSYKPPEMKSSEWDKKGNICTNHPSIWKQDYIPRKPQPAIPTLSDAKRETTKGKEVVIPMVALKRKRIADAEPDFPDISEGELQSMYAVSEKKMKLERDPSEPENSEDEDPLNDDFNNALEQLSETLDVDANTVEAAVSDFSQNGMEEYHEEGHLVSPPEARKSRNPFAKAQSPRKKSALPAEQFSALKRFNKIKKTALDPDTLIHSRYFASPKFGGKTTESSENLSTELQDDSTTVESHAELKEEKEISVNKDIKAPLSPVQTNTLTVKTEKTFNTSTVKTEKIFKWGKLSDMFSYKSEKNLKLANSPATTSSFKSVITSKSAPCTPRVNKENTSVSSNPRVSKENDVDSLENCDDPESISLSQRSCLSEMSSAASDIGSVDYESFGLTPNSTTDSIQNSQDEDHGQPLSQDADSTSPPAMKSPVVQQQPLNQRILNKSRPVGLSKSRGKAQKRPDPRQLNLRDMFAFKKNVPKLQSAKPSL